MISTVLLSAATVVVSLVQAGVRPALRTLRSTRRLRRRLVVIPTPM